MNRITTRRELLRMLAAGLAGSALLPALACAQRRDEASGTDSAAGLADSGTDRAHAALLDRFGLQLYTVRRALASDIEGTIAAIAAAGITELEFAGYYDKPASWWVELLGKHGLTTPATHIALPATDAAWAPHFERANAMGHRWVIVPFIGNDYRNSAGWKRLAARLNSGGELARAAGLRMGYHNHDFEFADAGGNMHGLDILLAETDPALVDFELDIYWAVKAGKDPLALLASHPQRFTCCHVKDAGPPPARAMMDVGAGTIDFKSILERGRTGALQHWFIEHDNPADPIASVRASAAALKQL
jgi:sugar phosphate isomerase/epimerase